jgi:hypothetical protein
VVLADAALAHRAEIVKAAQHGEVVQAVVGELGTQVLGGRAADLYGRRRIFLLGMGLFTAASLAGGLAQSQGMLIAARTARGWAARSCRPPRSPS